MLPGLVQPPSVGQPYTVQLSTGDSEHVGADQKHCNQNLHDWFLGGLRAASLVEQELLTENPEA